MPLILGVDNGLGGALAFLDTKTSTLQVLDMPTKAITVARKPRNEFDVDAFIYIMNECDVVAAWLEQNAGAKGQSPARAYTFGHRSGEIYGVCRARGIPTFRVPPLTWKRSFGLLGKDKTASRDCASFLFPDAAGKFTRKMDDGRAEAALIALYGLNQP